MHYVRTDTDKVLEERSGVSVAQLFVQQGESAFREMERALILETMQLDDTVIACGGGTPCFFDTMDRMLAQGVVIYLQVPVDRLFERLRTRKEKRPLIAGMDDDALKVYIDSTLKQRELYYLRAHLHIDPAHTDLDALADTLRQMSLTGD